MSLVFCVMFCKSLCCPLVFLSLDIVMSVLLRFTDSDDSFWYLQTLLPNDTTNTQMIYSDVQGHIWIHIIGDTPQLNII